MSDILIKGMKMPVRCEDCPMGHELNVGTCVTGYGCLATLNMGNASIRPISCGTKPKWCPLIEVPPHGRLIDADAIEYNMSSLYSDKIKMVSKSAIENMPTIIEAEEWT